MLARGIFEPHFLRKRARKAMSTKDKPEAAKKPTTTPRPISLRMVSMMSLF